MQIESLRINSKLHYLLVNCHVDENIQLLHVCILRQNTRIMEQMNATYLMGKKYSISCS